MGTYEMFWDCTYCGTKELLGLTHRHCPGCGAPQDATKRYFPPEDRKVAVEEHRFVGADRRCGACHTPMSAAATFCTSCGAALDGSAEVRTVEEAPAPKPPTPPPARGGGGLLIGCGALVLLAVLFALVYAFWTTSTEATVTGHAWERSLTVEELREVEDGAWRDALPPAAQDVRCAEKKRSTRQVPDGEDCRTVKKDQGDGTYREEQQCTPRTRSEDVLDTWCQYRIERWVPARTETSRGEALAPAPAWPEVAVNGCAHRGCTRAGDRAASYVVHLDVGDGEPRHCEVDEKDWARFAVGDRYEVALRVVDGSVQCGDLSPR